jgi:hypothetical protein
MMLNSVTPKLTATGRLVPFIMNDFCIKETSWINGKPYFTRKAIGELLEYRNPQKAIDNIIDRNPHINDFSVTLNLRATDGKKYDMEVYDPIGLQLIIFESHQPKAINFKVAVAHLVWAFMNGKLKPSKWSAKSDLVSAATQILSLPEGRHRGSLIKDLAERDGVCLRTAYRRIYKATGERMLTTKGLPRKRRSDRKIYVESA